MADNFTNHISPKEKEKIYLYDTEGRFNCQYI